MGETRKCAQCGKSFEPRREHSRFCSPGCRVEWIREHAGDPAGAANALAWSITAMTEATARLARVAPLDAARMAGAVSEAVWWVTIVDATMVRYESEAYDRVLDGLSEPDRQRTEETLAGLRYVRNQMGVRLDPADFIRAAPDGTWVWNSLPEPCWQALSPRGQDWEMARYRAYQSWLAGREVIESFTFALGFLTQTAAVEPGVR